MTARRAALAGDVASARTAYAAIDPIDADEAWRARLLNDLGTLDVLAGEMASGEDRFREALQIDSDFRAARANLALIGASLAVSVVDDGDAPDREPPVKIAIVSFLFNWPSTGGGIIHTVELARFLAVAGYDVRLYAPQYAGWNIGNLADDCPVPVELIPFAESDWKLPTIKQRLRATVDSFAPDHTILTDCWNMKPQLADALQGHSLLWRMQALECLCPLNNLRLLSDRPGEFVQCEYNQLSAPGHCLNCLKQRNRQSGPLHRSERALAEVWTSEYRQLLRQTLREAAAMLVLNPAVAELYRPHCDNVQVVTWGMDADRFPTSTPQPQQDDGVIRILFAGVVHELIKGFQILVEACRRLWRERQDFELVVTADPPQQIEPFTRFVGWQSQSDLPTWYADCDITAVPTIAQDGLSRTSVEAMASARPVIASRIGGLPYTVEDGVTGLLCEPGDPADWAEQLNRLLDDAALRRRLGENGRREFDRRFRWETVIENQYRPLLRRRQAAQPAQIEQGAHRQITTAGGRP